MGDCMACGRPAGGLWVDVEGDGGEFRRATCCERCQDLMDADMWVRRAHWEALTPRVPFDLLPRVPA